MDRGTVQIGFAFHAYRPLCAHCGVRSAKPNGTGGFWRKCARCLQSQATYRQRHTPQAPCSRCGKPRAAWANPQAKQGYCSTACRHATRKPFLERIRAELWEALGNRCTCPGCGWHDGPCVVTDLALLEVHHTKGNGHLVRRARQDGGRHPRHTQLKVSVKLGRYLREIRADPTGHGLQALCANCHRAVTVARRAPLDPPRQTPRTAL